MTIGILKEPEFENRVSVLPEGIPPLLNLKTEISIEKGAGEKAFSSDKDYEDQSCKISDRENILTNSDIIIGIHAPKTEELDKIKEGALLFAQFNPLSNKEYVQALQNKGITSFSFDMIPRSTRGQAMDVLSSMATVSGYKAVLAAASNLPTFFPMFMTAAGTIKPANILILGAGVAGLQAIAIARKLGAQVYVFDVRAAVKEEVMSLGGKFVEVEGSTDDASAGGYAVEQTEEFKIKQQQAIHDQALKSNVIICTAQIPGRDAPLLIKKETIEGMKPGSVIIDLAASSGGNAELTKNNETIIHNGVKIIGQSNYPSEMPADSSKMFGKNVLNLIKLFINEEGNTSLNFEDEIVSGCCVTHNKEIINERVKNLLS